MVLIVWGMVGKGLMEVGKWVGVKGSLLLLGVERLKGVLVWEMWVKVGWVLLSVVGFLGCMGGLLGELRVIFLIFPQWLFFLGF